MRELFLLSFLFLLLLLHSQDAFGADEDTNHTIVNNDIRPSAISTVSSSSSSSMSSPLIETKQLSEHQQQHENQHHQQQQKQEVSPSSFYRRTTPQLRLRPRVITLNIMVAGLSGLGKTTTCRSLLDTWSSSSNNDVNSEEDKVLQGGSEGGEEDVIDYDGKGRTLMGRWISNIGKEKQQFDEKEQLQPKSFVSTTSLSSSTTSYSPSTTIIEELQRFEHYDSKANTLLRVRIIDTPGFGNCVDHRGSVKPIANYVAKCRENRYHFEMFGRKGGKKGKRRGKSIKEKHEDDDDTNDKLVHVCLYFLSPGRFLTIDAHFLKIMQRQDLCIVPIIAKADTMTNDEIALYRNELKDVFRKEGIQVYDFDTAIGGAGETLLTSSSSLSIMRFQRGRRRGETLAIVSRNGYYPWGISRAYDSNHSDLNLIRRLLLSEHTERFVDIAEDRYALYRTNRMADARLKRMCYNGMVMIGLVTAFCCGTSTGADAGAFGWSNTVDTMDRLFGSAYHLFYDNLVKTAKAVISIRVVVPRSKASSSSGTGGGNSMTATSPSSSLKVSDYEGDSLTSVTDGGDEKTTEPTTTKVISTTTVIGERNKRPRPWDRFVSGRHLTNNSTMIKNCDDNDEARMENNSYNSTTLQVTNVSTTTANTTKRIITPLTTTTKYRWDRFLLGPFGIPDTGCLYPSNNLYNKKGR